MFGEHLDFSDFAFGDFPYNSPPFGGQSVVWGPYTIIWPFEKMLNNYIYMEIQMYKIRISAIREFTKLRFVFQMLGKSK